MIEIKCDYCKFLSIEKLNTKCFLIIRAASSPHENIFVYNTKYNERKEKLFILRSLKNINKNCNTI